MKLVEMTYSKVEEYLKTKRSIILPIGSTEQHSPVGLLGTDHLIAQELAFQVGKETQTIVAPTMCYGMSNHHLAFPGTISLNPTTLIALVKDVILSLYRNGFRKFYFLNGHGGNIASVQAAFSELTREINIQCKIMSWWTLPEINQLIIKLFGDNEGHHATPSEISLTIYLYKKCFQEKIAPFTVEHKDYSWPLSPEDFKKLFPDGRMESDPSLANYSLGKQIFDEAVKIIRKDHNIFINM